MKPSANPVHAPIVDWVPLRQGVSFRPLRFASDGYSLQLRVEPGTTISRHRHTGEVHAYNIRGYREIIETSEIAGPGTYVYEPPGNLDSWRCVGDAACVVQINLKGRVEYLDENGTVVGFSDTHTARETYLNWCKDKGRPPMRAIMAAACRDASCP